MINGILMFLSMGWNYFLNRFLFSHISIPDYTKMLHNFHLLVFLRLPFGHSLHRSASSMQWKLVLAWFVFTWISRLVFSNVLMFVFSLWGFSLSPFRLKTSTDFSFFNCSTRSSSSKNLFSTILAFYILKIIRSCRANQWVSEWVSKWVTFLFWNTKSNTCKLETCDLRDIYQSDE